MQYELARLRGGRAIRSVSLPLFMFLFGVTLLVGLGQGAAAQKIEIEEVDIEKQSATPEQPAHFSLLDDGHDDKIFSFRSPDYFSVETYRVAVIADANSLVPIERLEQEDDGGERIKYFLFHRSTHGDCHLAGVKFFRKIADGKVAGFYAIQWDRWLGDAVPDDLGGLDDFRNAIIVYEVFRFERRESKPAGDYSRFRKVAEKRIIVQSCDEAESNKDVVDMISNY
jgi:hypothetical protein